MKRFLACHRRARSHTRFQQHCLQLLRQALRPQAASSNAARYRSTNFFDVIEDIRKKFETSMTWLTTFQQPDIRIWNAAANIRGSGPIPAQHCSSGSYLRIYHCVAKSRKDGSILAVSGGDIAPMPA
ncbi:hypothetical protein [Sphingopyxis sp. 22461]|uniref:hypothetical protein n=1 Tax=Sphingopyxis sp. 22461 TaxID=3453923 RepID=UPI003F87990C